VASGFSPKNCRGDRLPPEGGSHEWVLIVFRLKGGSHEWGLIVFRLKAEVTNELY
jgi:hypothetical protein